MAPPRMTEARSRRQSSRREIGMSQPRTGAAGGAGSTLKHELTSGVKRHGHRLVLEVIIKCLLAQLAADAAGLEAAERRRGVEDVVAVHPDRAGANAVGDGVGLADVARPDRR